MEGGAAVWLRETTSAAQQLVKRLNQGIWGGYRYVLALYLNVAIWLSVDFE